MGMDVYGNAPSSKDGKYFRASVWSWPPILDLCREAIERFGLGIDTKGWDHNDGRGCAEPEKCVALAGGLDQLLAERGNKIGAAKGSRSEAGEIALRSLLGAGWEAAAPAYETDAEHVREFCTFLRACGGFEIH
jgi:hypothetical protein